MALVYGLDTGSWKLRLAAMEGSFGRFALRDVQEVAVLPEQGGGVPMAEALQALREAEPKWDQGEVAAALPLEQGVVRLVTLPFADKAAVSRAVPAEVEAVVPYDIEDMVLVTRLVDVRENVSRTLVHIAPREYLGARIEALKAASADPKVLCLDVAALAAYADKGVQVVLDIGHSRTLLAVCLQGALVAGRVIAAGGAAVTVALAEALGMEPGDAEALKHTLTVQVGDALVSEWDAEERTETNLLPGEDGAPPAEAAIRTTVEGQIAMIRAELIALEDDLKVGIDEILLCGGGSRLGGLTDLLSARIGVPVRTVVVPGGYPVDCALAVGLARVAAGDWKAPDLRVEEFAYHGAADLLWNVVAYSTLAAGVALFAGLALFGVRLYDADQRLAELDGKVVSTVTGTFADIPADRVTDGSMALALMQEKVTETTSRVDKLGSIVSGVPPTLEMLRTLSDRAPAPSDARIDVKELIIGEDAVSMKAETDSYETAAKIEAAWQAEPRFKGAKKSDEKKAGASLLFSLTIPLQQKGGEETSTAGSEG
jgi:Tfp pilus assembly PilM family ATPase